MHIRGALYQAVCVKKYAAALCLQLTPSFDALTAYSISCSLRMLLSCQSLV